MEYTLRKLNSKDIVPMCNIISKFGIEEFKKLLTKENLAALVDKNGDFNGEQLEGILGLSMAIDAAAIVLANLDKCEDELFKFLANMSNIEKEELEKMPPAKFMGMIMDVFNQEEFTDFFGVVSKLLKLK